MKRLFLLLLLIPQLLYAQFQSKDFTLSNERSSACQVLGLITEKDTVVFLNIGQQISGLFISGLSSFDNEQDSYARVTLKDKNDVEYLVYENYPLLSGSMVSPFSKVSLEACLLNDIDPISLKIEAHSASINIDSIYFTAAQNLRQGFQTKASMMREVQTQAIANKLNDHLREKRIPWYAGPTSIASKTFEEKKQVLGNSVPCLYGFEYYKGGLYMINPINSYVGQQRSGSNTFVRHFDWRDRHGKDWITSVKEQQGQTCWAHAVTATVESNFNIYYNQVFPDDIYNNNLSEQELISCVTADHCSVWYHINNGGYPMYALDYIQQNGIVREECFRFVGEVPCENKCTNPSDCVSFESFRNLHSSNNLSTIRYLYNDTISVPLRKAIIKSPVVVSYKNQSAHTVSCVGFHQIQLGDTLCNDVSNMNMAYFFVVNDSNSYLVNQLCWMIKNSWGTDWGESGFAKVSFNNVYLRLYELSGPYTSYIYTDNDICVTDDDMDGVYVWGSGPKPIHCPAWAPDNPDGDDTDRTIGQMNEYGICDTLSINSPMYEYIRNDSTLTIAENRTKYLGILRGASVTVQAQQTFSNGTKLLLDGGATLIIDGTTINGSSIQSYAGSKIILNNNGKILKPFEVPLGVEMIINHGRIE